LFIKPSPTRMSPLSQVDPGVLIVFCGRERSCS